MFDEHFFNKLKSYFEPQPTYVDLKKSNKGLGVYTQNSKVYLYYIVNDQAKKFNLTESDDGFFFTKVQKNLSIIPDKKIKTIGGSLIDFNLSNQSENKTTILLYKYVKNAESTIQMASSNNQIDWKEEKTTLHINETGNVVSSYQYKNVYVLYYGEKNINIAFTKDFKKWELSEKPVLKPRRDYFDCDDLEIENAFLIEKGILVIYHNKRKENGFFQYSVGAALFDSKNPNKLLWRSNEPIWRSTHEWRGKKASPFGVILFREKLISYWDLENEGIYAIVYSFYKLHFPSKTKNVSLHLKRSTTNPVIAPQSQNDWESFNTFNAATIYEAGKVHILYRAQGYDYISSLGYATSNDGYQLDKRLNRPVFTSTHAIPKQQSHLHPNDSTYASGGSYGGCEDPRLTKIDNRFYMTYVANDGSLPRLALTSISVEDFLNQRWLWEKPVLISPPGVIDKSGCILPEKINNKYVIFHRIFPNILIDYVDSLNFTGDHWLKGQHEIKIRPDKWDSRKIGAGAPPIKTRDGWLLIYYGVDDKDASKYKIGAMLLDLQDPTKVLHRSNAPILEPNERFENEGFKPGIAYPCGAIVIKETLFVYYGGADSVVCVATANLNHFLSELKYSEIAILEQAIIRKVL